MDHFVAQLGAWRGGKGPLHARLAEAIMAAIDRRDLTIGTALPAERTLAELLDISRGTVVAAMRSLAGQGVIQRVRGSGSVVAARSSRPARDRPRDTRLAQVYDKVGNGVIEMVAAAPLGHGAIPDAVWQTALTEMDGLSTSTGYFYAQGLPALRGAIAGHMGGWGLDVDPDDIAVCNGAQQAISLVAQTFLNRGDCVVVEEYTWAGAIDAFRAAGARVVTVPSDGAGPDVAHLRETLANAKPVLVYLCSSVNNPTGVTMPATRRMRVTEACAAHGVMLVDDCIFHDVVIGDRPNPLASYEPRPSVITIGSISKLFWGGLRIGWMHAPRDLLTRLTERRRIVDLGSPLVTQLVATHLLNGFAESMRERRVDEITHRLELVAQVAEREVPELEWSEPSGAYMVWMRLPYGDSREFAHFAMREGVAVLPGTLMSAAGAGADHIRLALIHDDATIIEAFARLGRAWRNFVPVADRALDRSDLVVV
jgi:DNA-binding transcriptional MocR family regulator